MQYHTTLFKFFKPFLFSWWIDYYGWTVGNLADLNLHVIIILHHNHHTNVIIIIFDTRPAWILSTSKNNHWCHISNMWVCTLVYMKFVLHHTAEFLWCSIKQALNLTIWQMHRFLFEMCRPKLHLVSKFTLDHNKIRWHVHVRLGTRNAFSNIHQDSIYWKALKVHHTNWIWPWISS